MTHKAGSLVYVEIQEAGVCTQVLYFKNDQRFFDWVAKYFNYTDNTNLMLYKRMANKAVAAEMDRTGRSYLRLALLVGEHLVRITTEIELFSEVLPESSEAFLTRFEGGARDILKRVKKDHFLHFGPANKDTPAIPLTAESYGFTHSQPGLLGFCLTPNGTIDLNNWYVTLADMHFLDGKYVIFGRIISGMRAFWGLNKSTTTWVGKPVEPVAIVGGSAYVEAAPEKEKPAESPTKTEKPDAKPEAELLEEAVDPVAEARASTKLQCAYRGKQGRKKAEEKRAEKKQIQEEKEENAAATKVQSLYRGKQSRQKVKEKKEAVMHAAVDDLAAPPTE